MTIVDGVENLVAQRTHRRCERSTNATEGVDQELVGGLLAVQRCSDLIRGRDQILT